MILKPAITYVPDEEILERCRNREPLGYKLLYEQYGYPMMGVVLQFSRTREDAEDMLHDGLMKVLSGIDSFRGEGAFEGWVKRIVRNMCIARYNHKKKYPQDDIDHHEGALVVEPAENFYEDYPITRGQLFDLIEALPVGYKSVFKLYVLGNYTHPQIAKKFGVSVNSSKSQLAKARRKLEGMLKEKYNIERQHT